VIHAGTEGWGDSVVLSTIIGGALFLAAFIWWERRTPSPMLPLGFFRDRSFTVANAASFLMYFGVFGAVFLLAQFFQFVQGYGPFQSGLLTLAWTGMPAIVAPIAGALSGRIGQRTILVAGLAMMAIGLAWFAAVATPTVPYRELVPALVIAGVGMGLFFAPIANVILSAVKPEQEGKASGANNAIRELGGVFGVAVLASIFSSFGSYESAQAYVDGLIPAVWVGAAFVGLGSVITLFLPRDRKAEQGAARGAAIVAGA